MRKKIIIGIAASLFAVAGLFGVNTMNQNANSDISLSSIAVMAEAQAESANSCKSYRRNGSVRCEANCGTGSAFCSGRTCRC